MKKFIVLVAVTLLGVGVVHADTATTPRQSSPRLETTVRDQDVSADPLAGSARRVRGVFRVFGDDDDVSTGPKASAPRRKSRRSSRARRSTEMQKSRGTRATPSQPEGILMLLDGILPAL